MRFPARPPPAQAPDFADLMELVPHISPTLPDGRYLHWDDLRRRPPPDGLTRERWWRAQKIARTSARVSIAGFHDDRGTPFSYCRLDAIDRATHRLDRHDALREMLEALGDDAIRREYRIDQLMEESISSSLIEGAKLTTRAQAKKMITDRLTPSSKGERMVMNNYLAMERLLTPA